MWMGDFILDDQYFLTKPTGPFIFLHLFGNSGMGSFGTVIIIVIITSHVRGDHMRPITPIPSPLPTYAFACSSLNELLIENMQITSQFSFLCYIRLQNF